MKLSYSTPFSTLIGTVVFEADLRNKDFIFYDDCATNVCIVEFPVTDKGIINVYFPWHQSQEQQGYKIVETQAFENAIIILRAKRVAEGVIDASSRLFLVNFIRQEFVYDFTKKNTTLWLSSIAPSERQVPTNKIALDLRTRMLYKFVDGRNLASFASFLSYAKSNLMFSDSLEEAGCEAALELFCHRYNLPRPNLENRYRVSDFIPKSNRVKSRFEDNSNCIIALYQLFNQKMEK